MLYFIIFVGILLGLNHLKKYLQNPEEKSSRRKSDQTESYKEVYEQCEVEESKRHKDDKIYSQTSKSEILTFEGPKSELKTDFENFSKEIDSKNCRFRNLDSNIYNFDEDFSVTRELHNQKSKLEIIDEDEEINKIKIVVEEKTDELKLDKPENFQDFVELKSKDDEKSLLIKEDASINGEFENDIKIQSFVGQNESILNKPENLQDLVQLEIKEDQLKSSLNKEDASIDGEFENDQKIKSFVVRDESNFNKPENLQDLVQVQSKEDEPKSSSNKEDAFINGEFQNDKKIKCFDAKESNLNGLQELEKAEVKKGSTDLFEEPKLNNKFECDSSSNHVIDSHQIVTEDHKLEESEHSNSYSENQSLKNKLDAEHDLNQDEEAKNILKYEKLVLGSEYCSKDNKLDDEERLNVIGIKVDIEFENGIVNQNDIYDKVSKYKSDDHSSTYRGVKNIELEDIGSKNEESELHTLETNLLKENETCNEYQAKKVKFETNLQDGNILNVDDTKIKSNCNLDENKGEISENCYIQDFEDFKRDNGNHESINNIKINDNKDLDSINQEQHNLTDEDQNKINLYHDFKEQELPYRRNNNSEYNTYKQNRICNILKSKDELLKTTLSDEGYLLPKAEGHTCNDLGKEHDENLLSSENKESFECVEEDKHFNKEVVYQFENCNRHVVADALPDYCTGSLNDSHTENKDLEKVVDTNSSVKSDDLNNFDNMESSLDGAKTCKSPQENNNDLINGNKSDDNTEKMVHYHSFDAMESKQGNNQSNDPTIRNYPLQLDVNKGDNSLVHLTSNIESIQFDKYFKENTNKEKSQLEQQNDFPNTEAQMINISNEYNYELLSSPTPYAESDKETFENSFTTSTNLEDLGEKYYYSQTTTVYIPATKKFENKLFHTENLESFDDNLNSSSIAESYTDDSTNGCDDPKNISNESNNDDINYLDNDSNISHNGINKNEDELSINSSKDLLNGNLSTPQKKIPVGGIRLFGGDELMNKLRKRRSIVDKDEEVNDNDTENDEVLSNKEDNIHQLHLNENNNTIQDSITTSSFISVSPSSKLTQIIEYKPFTGADYTISNELSDSPSTPPTLVDSDSQSPPLSPFGCDMKSQTIELDYDDISAPVIRERLIHLNMTRPKGPQKRKPAMKTSRLLD